MTTRNHNSKSQDKQFWPLQGRCNVASIEKIESRFSGVHTQAAIVRLPSALSRLKALESLVLKGHSIASNGVPAQIFDGKSLPKLSRLEFGANDPIMRALDLSGQADVDEFLYF